MSEKRASIGARRNPDTEAAVLDAATALLEEKGIAGVTMEAVARRAPRRQGNAVSLVADARCAATGDLQAAETDHRLS